MLKGEWKKLLSNRLMLVVVLAVIAIPHDLHHPVSRFHVGPLWQRGKSAVALVNQDQPVEYEEKH